MASQYKISKELFIDAKNSNPRVQFPGVLIFLVVRMDAFGEYCDFQAARTDKAKNKEFILGTESESPGIILKMLVKSRGMEKGIFGPQTLRLFEELGYATIHHREFVKFDVIPRFGADLKLINSISADDIDTIDPIPLNSDLFLDNERALLNFDLADLLPQESPKRQKTQHFIADGTNTGTTGRNHAFDPNNEDPIRYSVINDNEILLTRPIMEAVQNQQKFDPSSFSDIFEDF